VRRQNTLRSTRTLACVAHWLLPWFSVLLVSSAIAHVSEPGLARTLREPPATAESSPFQSLPTPPGRQWLLIETSAADGSVTRLACLTSSGHSATDVLRIGFEERDQVVSELCAEVRPVNALGDGS
jgi:hypothetical protein